MMCVWTGLISFRKNRKIETKDKNKIFLTLFPIVNNHKIRSEFKHGARSNQKECALENKKRERGKKEIIANRTRERVSVLCWPAWQARKLVGMRRRHRRTYIEANGLIPRIEYICAAMIITTPSAGSKWSHFYYINFIHKNIIFVCFYCDCCRRFSVIILICIINNEMLCFFLFEFAVPLTSCIIQSVPTERADRRLSANVFAIRSIRLSFERARGGRPSFSYFIRRCTHFLISVTNRHFSLTLFSRIETCYIQPHILAEPMRNVPIVSFAVRSYIQIITTRHIQMKIFIGYKLTNYN